MTTKADKRWRETTRPHGGKGSASRPRDYKKYSDNWENIFGKNTTEDTNNTYQDTENFGQEKI
jgi:hypothetical protein